MKTDDVTHGEVRHDVTHEGKGEVRHGEVRHDVTHEGKGKENWRGKTWRGKT